MPTVTLPNNWTPRWYQKPSWIAWERGIKRSLLVWHRRAGKDDVALHKAAIAAHERVANYWHCLPMYEQARKAIWEAINPHSGKRRIDEAFPVELRKRTDNSNMTIEFKVGSIWRVVGSDNPDSLVGAPPAGIVFSEWALANPAAWAYLAPILAENGGWADFITTPRGRNHVKTMLDMARTSKDWFAEVLTIDDTQAVSRETVEQQRLEYHSIYGTDAGDALIEQEYWCSFEAAILGAYWGKEMVIAERDGRITDVQPDVALKVNTAWDLGVDDSMAIWFWQAGAGTIRVVDYHEGSGYGIEYYAKLIKDKAKDRGYQVGIDYVPHDAKVREMTSSGKDGKAKQRIEVMIECGLKPRLITDHKVADGISAVRQILPRVYFDAERCRAGLECLRQYRAEWDDDRRVFRQIPLHDWSSHGADAFRSLAMAYREIAPAKAVEKGRILSVGPGNQVTLNDLWKLQPKKSKRI